MDSSSSTTDRQLLVERRLATIEADVHYIRESLAVIRDRFEQVTKDNEVLEGRVRHLEMGWSTAKGTVVAIGSLFTLINLGLSAARFFIP